MLEQIDDEPYTIPYIFRDDFIKICESGKVNNSTEQLKLDVYRQIRDTEKTGYYKYDDAFKVAYKYFIYSWYSRIRIGYAYVINSHHQTEITGISNKTVVPEIDKDFFPPAYNGYLGGKINTNNIRNKRIRIAIAA